jgi:hypothetical protein
MKKALLLSVVALMGTSAFALNEETIFKYDYNKFTEHNIPKSKLDDMEGLWGNANIDNPAWTTVKGADQWSENTGLTVLSGNPGVSGYNVLTKGISIIDMGGEIGRVLCINGNGSNFNSFVQENMGAADFNAPAMASGTGYWHINWFAGPDTYKNGNGGENATIPTDGNIRVRITFNVFANSFGGTLVPKCIYAVNNTIGILPKGDNTAENVGTRTDKFAKYYDDDVNHEEDPEENEDGENFWDPNTWMVYEFDTWCPKNDGSTDYAPIYVKCEFNGWATGIQNRTVLVKSVEFLKVTDNTEPIVNTRKYSYIHLTNGVPTTDISTSSVSNIISNDSNAPVEVYNLSGVRVNAENLPAGLYIRRQGNEASKFVVR